MMSTIYCVPPTLSFLKLFMSILINDWDFPSSLLIGFTCDCSSDWPDCCLIYLLISLPIMTLVFQTAVVIWVTKLGKSIHMKRTCIENANGNLTAFIIFLPWPLSENMRASSPTIHFQEMDYNKCFTMIMITFLVIIIIVYHHYCQHHCNTHSGVLD